MKPALLVIDMQKAYHTGASAGSMDAACEYINGAADTFRKKGLPVIWIQHTEEYGGVLPGRPGFEIIDGLKPLEGEPRVVKAYGNSFNKTGLKAILDARGVDTVIVTGYCAEYCVLSTCRGARDLDLAGIILRGAIASGVEENVGFVERISDLMSFGAMLKALP
jgi:nicotinamidase-related amidase